MKIYHVTAPGFRGGYDTYSDFVIVCASSEEAALTHPAGHKLRENPYGRLVDARDGHPSRSWAEHLDQIEVKPIGTAAPDAEPGIVCASFCAG